MTVSERAFQAIPQLMEDIRQERAESAAQKRIKKSESREKDKQDRLDRIERHTKELLERIPREIAKSRLDHPKRAWIYIDFEDEPLIEPWFDPCYAEPESKSYRMSVLKKISECGYQAKLSGSWGIKVRDTDVYRWWDQPGECVIL